MSKNIQRSDIVDPSEGGQPAPIHSDSSIPIISEYPPGSGKPTILLNPGGRFPVSFGLAKARMVLANMRFIQTFVDTNGASVE